MIKSRSARRRSSPDSPAIHSGGPNPDLGQPLPPISNSESTGPEERSSEPFQQIFKLLNDSSKVNFAHYKQSTLQRRVYRRMSLERIERIDDYVKVLQCNPKELTELFNDLLIHVTNFFRDPEAFDFLKQEVLPRLILAKEPARDLRLWVPACATGEEVYSLAIVAVEALAQLKMQSRVQIFGSDLSEIALATARAGIYPDTISEFVSEDRLRRFFVKKGSTYRITREIRDLCTFSRQNICDDPPFSRIDLLSCRNLLIYFGPTLKRKCVPIFHYALNAHGALILGGSETIGGFAELFSLVDKKQKIYAKKTAIAQVPSLKSEPASRVSPKPLPVILKANPPAREPKSSSQIQQAADQLILTHFAPCGVLVDGRLQVWHFRGQTATYLEHAPGVASLNILKMVRAPLAGDLTALLHQCITQKRGVRRTGISFETDGLVQHLTIEVIPFVVEASAERWMLIMFQPVNVSEPPIRIKDFRKAASPASLREIERLQTELASTKESLQAIIEEQEATNEELKAANEEIESSNEELQSTNEELETAKEELQSTNEEITTVNDELNSRHIEISEINGDLNNLLSSINIAIIMVDDALTIRRTTPLAEKTFNIIPTDVGRRLSDINPNINAPELIPMIREVIENLTPRECEVQDREGRFYALRVRPYRTQENVINGAVITLLDIHDIKLAMNRNALKPRKPQAEKRP